MAEEVKSRDIRLHKQLDNLKLYRQIYADMNVICTKELGNDWFRTEGGIFGVSMDINVRTGFYRNNIGTKEEGDIYEYICHMKKMDVTASNKVFIMRALVKRYITERAEIETNIPPEKMREYLLENTQDDINYFSERYKLSKPIVFKNIFRCNPLKMTGIKSYPYALVTYNGDFQPHGMLVIGLQGDSKIFLEKNGFINNRGIFSSTAKNVILCFNPIDTLNMMQIFQDSIHVEVIGLVGRFWNVKLRQYIEGKGLLVCLRNEGMNQMYIENEMLPYLNERDKMNAFEFLEVRKRDNWEIASDEIMSKEIMDMFSEDTDTVTKKPIKLERLSDIDDPRNSDKYIEVEATIFGEVANAYDSPKEFTVDRCTLITAAKCADCVGKVFKVGLSSPFHLSRNGNIHSINNYCMSQCCTKKVKGAVKILSKYTLREVIACDYQQKVIDKGQFDANGKLVKLESVQSASKKIINVHLKVNKTTFPPGHYKLLGWIRTNPMNSVRTLLVHDIERIPDEYEVFDYLQHINELDFVRKLGPMDFMEELTNHYTKIYQSKEMLLSIMLTFCSPLIIKFNGQYLNAWMKTAIVGDTGVGKTRIYETIGNMTGFGDVFSSLTGKRTGLLYATVIRDKSWECQGGLFTQNNHKILCIEEAQDLPREDLKKMAIAMDSGVLKVDNVANAKYVTQTRLILNCNPIKDKTVSSYSYGCFMLKELFHNMFIRRTDLVVITKRIEDKSIYNKEPVQAEPRLKPEHLRSLINYAWSLTPERIIISEEVEKMIYENATKLSNVFGDADDIQIVSPGDFKNSLARICAAYAVLCMSSHDNFSTITVEPNHVKEMVSFIYHLYNSPACRLGDYSRQCRILCKLEDFDLYNMQFKEKIKTAATNVLKGNYGFMIMLHLLTKNHRFTLNDIRKMYPTLNMDKHITYLEEGRFITCAENGMVFTTDRFSRFWNRFETMNPEETSLVELVKIGE